MIRWLTLDGELGFVSTSLVLGAEQFAGDAGMSASGAEANVAAQGRQRSKRLEKQCSTRRF